MRMRLFAEGLTPVAIQRTDPHDNDQSTRATIELMRQYAQAGSSDPVVVNATRAALSCVPMSAPAWRKAQAVYEWVCRRIRFRTDEDALVEMGLSPDQELLIPPAVLLEWRRGDCDDFAQLTCAMLACAGVSSAFDTIAADPETPYRWSHVYSVAFLEDGSRLPVDTAARAQGRGRGLGWEAPMAYKRAEWVVS